MFIILRKLNSNRPSIAYTELSRTRLTCLALRDMPCLSWRPGSRSEVKINWKKLVQAQVVPHLNQQKEMNKNLP